MRNNFIKFLIAGILIITCKFSYAQFGVNSPKSWRTDLCFSDKLKEEDYNKLKNSTTYFVCPNSLVKEKENFQTLLNDAWDYNKIEVINDDEMKDYLNEKNATFLSIGLLSTGSVAEVYMELWMVKDLSKNFRAENRTIFARFNIHFLCEFISKFKKGDDELFSYLSNEADLRNIKPGIVANYLKFIEGYIKEQKTFSCHDNFDNHDELEYLKNDTLYITENVKIRHASRFKYCCETEEQIDNEKFMAQYPYPYAFISFEELNRKIIDGEKFYYAICIKSHSVVRHISVFKSKTGECLYNRKIQGSPDYNSADFNLLKNKIDK